MTRAKDGGGQRPFVELESGRPVREVATLHRHHAGRFLSTAQLALVRGEYELAAVLAESAASLSRGAGALVELEQVETEVARLRSLAAIGRKPKRARSVLSLEALEELGEALEAKIAELGELHK